MIEFGREVYLTDDLHGANLKACDTTAKAIPWPLGSRSCRIQVDDGKVRIPEAQESPETQRSVDLIPLSLPQGPAGICITENRLLCTGAKAVKPPTQGRGR